MAHFNQEACKELKSRAMEEVEKQRAVAQRIIRELHDHPEVRMEEHFASRFLTELLEDTGANVERGVAGLPTAFKATLTGLAESPRIGIGAEYDALPEIGHGCAHNVIAAMAVAAFRALASIMPQLHGTLMVIGTPGEEGGAGKIIMLEKGAFDDVDAFFMIHPDRCTRIAWGHNGRIFMEIEFHGKQAHAASAPEEGINALDALILTYNGINAMRQHLKDGARLHGIIVHGGNSPNVIPHYAKGSFYVRSADMDYLFKLRTRIEDIARGAAAMTGAKVQFSEPRPLYLPSKMNRTMMEAFVRNYEILGISVDFYQECSRGSTDFGNVSQKIPSIHPYLKIHDGEAPLHTAEMAKATLQPMALEAAINGAKAMAMVAVDLMCDHESMERARQEFKGSKR